MDQRVKSDGYATAFYALRNAAPAFRDRDASGKWPAMPQITELWAQAIIMWVGFVEAMDVRLGEAQWIAEGDYTFADITALVTIDFAAKARLTLPDGAANLARWHAAATARPSAAA